MKKNYTKPEIKVVKLDVSDIITTSGNAPGPELKVNIAGKSAENYGAQDVSMLSD